MSRPTPFPLVPAALAVLAVLTLADSLWASSWSAYWDGFGKWWAGKFRSANGVAGVAILVMVAGIIMIYCGKKWR